MQILNKTNSDIITTFTDEFSLQLAEVLPEKTISIFSEDSKIAQDLWGADMLKREPLVQTLGNILYNHTVCEQCGFSREEIYAGLLHEIGHFVNNIVCGHKGEQQHNEFAADDFACEHYTEVHLVNGLYKILWKCELSEDEKQKIQDRIARINIRRWNIPMPQQDYMVVIHCSTYNHEKYIESALKGFVMQKTNFPFCALVIDDCSTDKTRDIILQYAAQYPDIIKPLLLGENHMQHGKLRNPYYEPWYNRGKYLAVCEGDDYWTHPDKLQKQVDYLEAHPDCTLCFHAYLNEYPDASKSSPVHPKFKSKDGTYRMNKLIAGGGGFMATNSMVYKTTYQISRPQWMRKYLQGDLMSMLWLGQHGYAYYINEVMSVYRVSATGSWTAKRNAAGIKQTTKNFFADCKMWWEIWRWQKGKYPFSFLYRYAMTTYVYLRTVLHKMLGK